MAHVKTLMRRTAVSPITMPQAAPTGILASIRSAFSSIGDVFNSATQTRKSADGGPLSFATKVTEFIARNAPDAPIEPGIVLAALTKLKTPIMVALGVAAVAGIVYVAYKLYKHFSERGAESAVDTIMADLKSVAPAVFEVPGWIDKVRAEIETAVRSGPETMIAEVAKIKAGLIDKQEKSTGRPAGSGVNMFTEGASRARGRHRGGGMVAA